MSTVEIGSLIDDAAGRGDLTDSNLRQLFAAATGLDEESLADAWEAVEDAVIAALPDGSGLRVRPGGWVVDIRSSVIRTVVAAALVGGALWHVGLDQLPGYVAPAVIPLLVDVRKVRLSRADDRLLVDLRLTSTTAQMDWPWPADALYGRLPADVRERVAPGDFADFVDRLVQAGEADPAGYDEVRLRPAGQPAWIRITAE
jgi:hypothetical protein